MTDKFPENPGPDLVGLPDMCLTISIVYSGITSWRTSLAGLAVLPIIRSARTCMRSRATKVLRFGMFLGLLVLEMGLIVGFYILPQFQARNAPAGHWEMETPLHDSPEMRLAVIAFLGFVAVGTIGLMTMVWRAFKELKIHE